MENHFKIKVEYISSDKKAIDAAAQYMKLYQLEAYDAMHLAIARNKCDYFITLDQDFIQNFLKKDKNLQTKVIVFDEKESNRSCFLHLLSRSSLHSLK